MADIGSTQPARDSGGGVSQSQVEAVLSAVDLAFGDVLHARYGGGINSVFLKGSNVQEQCLRPAPAGVTGYLLMEVRLLEKSEDGTASSPTGFGRLFSGLSTVIGVLTVTDGPSGRTSDVTVKTEVFDDHDSGERISAATLQHGVLLREKPPYLTGALGHGGIFVARSEQGMNQAGKADRQSQRGWMAHPVRTRTNRAGGLGHNGHRRAAPVSLPVPVSARLLRRLGDRLTDGNALGATLERMVLGLENGDAG